MSRPSRVAVGSVRRLGKRGQRISASGLVPPCVRFEAAEGVFKERKGRREVERASVVDGKKTNAKFVEDTKNMHLSGGERELPQTSESTADFVVHQATSWLILLK